jgi:hypothetical protein
VASGGNMPETTQEMAGEAGDNQENNTESKNDVGLSQQAEGGDDTARKDADQAPAATQDGKTPDPEGAKDPEDTPERAAKREGRRFERRIGNEIRKAAEARAEAEHLRRQLEQFQRAQPQPQDPTAPRLEDFTDVLEFQKAVEKYGYEKGAKEAEVKRQREAQGAALKNLVSNWEKRAGAAESKYDDFYEVVGELTPTQPWALAVMEADNGDDIAYYLGKHLDEARQIAAMPASSQIRAIGKLEAKLASEPAKLKTPSKAPAPINPVNGKSSGTSDLPQDSDSIDVWMKKEAAREKRMRGG